MLNMLKDYINMLRPKHYLKNFLIFIPIIFSGNFFKSEMLFQATASFITFSMIASVVYIVNDLKDRDHDRLHHKKKYRPIASGKVSVNGALITLIGLLTAAVLIQYFVNPSAISFGLLFAYLAINLLYSSGLKNVPVVDVSILAFGFLIRIFYGADAVSVEVSQWLYLAILSFSYYMSLGKRRNELRTQGSSTRKVNAYYNHEFLDRNMYMCTALTIVFYSLWTVDPSQQHDLMIWTVPLVIVIAMTYSLSVEKNDSDGDPINVLTAHRPLLLTVMAYGALIMGIVYLS